MAEKKISKAKLDELLALCREYYHGAGAPDEDALHAMTEAAKALEHEAGIGMFALLDVISGIVLYSGLKRDATNEDIYKVLEVLGWLVTADEQAEH